jgi:hypothetical protein
MDFTAVIAALTGAEAAIATAITAAIAKIGSGTTVTPPDAIAQIQAIADKLTADAAALQAAAQ